jgi:hypothetical protein
MRKHAAQLRRLLKLGGVTALGVGATLGLIAPSAAGAQTRGFTIVAYVSNCSIAPASGMGPKLCSTGGQVVRIG